MIHWLFRLIQKTAGTQEVTGFQQLNRNCILAINKEAQ